MDLIGLNEAIGKIPELLGLVTIAFLGGTAVGVAALCLLDYIDRKRAGGVGGDRCCKK